MQWCGKILNEDHVTIKDEDSYLYQTINLFIELTHSYRQMMDKLVIFQIIFSALIRITMFYILMKNDILQPLYFLISLQI